eukprot:TRINITY_DN198_c0_g2_i6.p1 TRINITY_DN198_c0_g2~~TRINITY_DN198_c0_g2_i6.p1  ORF type:complete len:657 (+),score=205.77 TRINITY_DN198_c0_g2_i6:74-2044(+)
MPGGYQGSYSSSSYGSHSSYGGGGYQSNYPSSSYGPPPPSSSSSYNSHPSSSSSSSVPSAEEDNFVGVSGSSLYGGQANQAGIDFDKYDDIPVETSGRDVPKPISKWEDSLLHETLLRNVTNAGYTKPTPVQKYSISVVCNNRDLMSCAQTGSGKTAAFLLPILSQLLKTPREVPNRQVCYPQALVLAPTRELAIQINDEARKFMVGTGLRCAVVYGGSPMGLQLRELERGCDLIVATPGRLCDIIERGRASVFKIKFLVLDEADRMLDMGFEPQIRRLVEREGMPPKGTRQTLMFSATFPKEIQRLAASFLEDYVFLTIGRVGATTELVTQKFIQVTSDDDKNKRLFDLIREVPKGELTLIFVETKKKANSLDYLLRRERVPATSIHGDRTQGERVYALRTFSTGQTPFLIATNVAARGLDISGVTHVINYEMPNNIDDYVHRIGRTGRAGKHGVSTSFISYTDAGIIPDLIEKLHDSNAEVPKWMEEITPIRKSKKAQGGRFGGRDFRKDNHGSFGHSNGHSNNYSNGHSNNHNNNYGNGSSYAPRPSYGSSASVPPATQSYSAYPGYSSYTPPAPTGGYGNYNSGGSSGTSQPYGSSSSNGGGYGAYGSSSSYGPQPPSTSVAGKRDREYESGYSDGKKPRYDERSSSSGGRR